MLFDVKIVFGPFVEMKDKHDIVEWVPLNG